MKKLLMVGMFALMSVTSANALGIGVVFGGASSWNGWGFGWGAGFSLGLGSLEKVSWEFAIRASAGNRYFNINVDADYHFYQYNFTDWVGFYVGVGPYVGLTIRSKHKNYDSNRDKDWNKGYGGGFGIDVGARIPLGFRFFFAEHFDIWLALVPNIGLYIGLGDYYSNNRFGIGGGIGGELGFRFWF
jgi:Protein of unknown function (DUF3996)